MVKSIHSGRYQRLIQRLVESRKRQGIRQRELSRRIGQYITFVSKYETLERRLDIIEFVDVCEALGENPVTLLKLLMSDKG
jgi:transcriptional regulator with XRE-family HTH domain